MRERERERELYEQHSHRDSSRALLLICKQCACVRERASEKEGGREGGWDGGREGGRERERGWKANEAVGTKP